MRKVASHPSCKMKLTPICNMVYPIAAADIDCDLDNTVLVHTMTTADRLGSRSRYLDYMTTAQSYLIFSQR